MANARCQEVLHPPAAAAVRCKRCYQRPLQRIAVFHVEGPPKTKIDGPQHFLNTTYHDIFFLGFFLVGVFGRFSVLGEWQMTAPQTNIKKKSGPNPALIWPPTHPPTTGVTATVTGHRFFFPGSP
jgi:hypothetical protein